MPQVAKNTLNPEWNEIKLKLIDLGSGHLSSRFVLQCKDKDTFGSDFIGMVDTSIEELVLKVFLYVRVCIYVYTRDC